MEAGHWLLGKVVWDNVLSLHSLDMEASPVHFLGKGVSIQPPDKELSLQLPADKGVSLQPPDMEVSLQLHGMEVSRLAPVDKGVSPPGIAEDTLSSHTHPDMPVWRVGLLHPDMPVWRVGLLHPDRPVWRVAALSLPPLLCTAVAGQTL